MEVKRKLYHLHIDLLEEYEPAHKKNRIKLYTPLQIENMRVQGRKHLDIWCDGRIYPKNPISNTTPNFCSPSSLLRYVGDGHNGLLGYCNAVASQAKTLQYLYDILLNERSLFTTQHSKHIKELEEKGNTICILQKRLKEARMKKTKLGQRERERKLDNVETLKCGSGGLKRRIRAARILLHPNKKIEKSSTHGLCYSSLITPSIASSMLKGAKFKNLNSKIISDFVDKNTIQTRDIQKTLDDCGISRVGYTHLFDVIKKTLKQQNVKTNILPKPYHVRKERLYLNNQINNMIGKPYSVSGLFQFKERNIVFSEGNNIFYKTVSLQKAMVKYYNLTSLETNSVLVFVIKLDECEVLKQKKMERLTITIMNRALSPSLDAAGNVDKDSDNYFSVQSENHIWWLGCFQVDLEDHAILSWVFSRTDICSTIALQSNGEQLHVDGFGTFRVEWHMAGDLKTIKCMYNMPKGATSKTPCIYCMHTAQTLNISNHTKAPTRSIVTDPSLKPILDIPLSRVHICTMHALCRIVEKLIHLYIQFAWKEKNMSLHKENLKIIEDILSNIGLHGGKVKIVADPKRSTETHKVPCKPSIGGVKARRFLSFNGELGKINSKQGSTIKYGQWKVLHSAVKDHADGGRARTRKAEVWTALDEIFELCDRKLWEETFNIQLRTAVSKFGKAMTSGWSSNNITHYMHILYNHLPWFAKTYGSPGIWSTQGLEKSHYQARGAFFRHTRHGGGRERADSLREVFEWFYRRILLKMPNENNSIAHNDNIL